MDIFQSSDVSALRPDQIGHFAEYWVKLSLTLAGLDVYTSEVDNKGIDFLVRLSNGNCLDFQVKSFRKRTSYIFIPKHIWNDKLPKKLYIALVFIIEKKMPQLFLIPSTVWAKPNKIFVNRTYDKGQTSKPEWGINIPKNLDLLSEFDFIGQVEKIKRIM